MVEDRFKFNFEGVSNVLNFSQSFPSDRTSLSPVGPLGSWTPRAPQSLAANLAETLRGARPQSQWILSGSRGPLAPFFKTVEAAKNAAEARRLLSDHPRTYGGQMVGISQQEGVKTWGSLRTKGKLTIPHSK